MLLFAVLSLFAILAILKVLAFITHTDCRSKVCLVGKTALVTGGNSGIGYQIVLALVQRGCRVIIVDIVEDAHLLENIFKETGSRNVVFKYVDLCSFNSIRELAKQLINDEEKLDILINNAGIGRTISTVTEDGLDIVMEVNYFSAFLLTHLLVDLLKKAEGRVVFTSSLMSYFHSFSLKKLKPRVDSKDYIFSYNNSKLCLIMTANIFAEKLKKYGITSNTYHPGIVYTKIFRSCIQATGTVININWCIIQLLQFLSVLVGKSAEQGAQTAVYLACANKVKDVTGEFFYETKPTFKPKLAHDKKMCNDIWRETEELVKLKPNEKL